MRQALPNENNDTNGRNALAILSSFAGKLMAAMRRSRNECPPGEREREMQIVDATNEMLLVLFFFFISAGGIRDFSHKGRRGGGEAGSAGNSPFLAGVARQGNVGEKVV